MNTNSNHPKEHSKIYIEEFNDTLCFLSKDDSKYTLLHKIPIDELDEAYEMHGFLCSKHVMNVGSQEWTTKDCLYELAQVIVSYYPNSSINWLNTFLLCELSIQCTKTYHMNEDDLCSHIKKTLQEYNIGK
ncbi:MAG: hypothetical protein NVSMB45_01070 [Ginsengibacter sp.]